MTPTPEKEKNVDTRKFVDGYLCRAWGETDHTEVACVTTLEEVECFIVEAQFGEYVPLRRLGVDEENHAMLEEQLAAMKDTLVNDSDTWQINFEIGGISVERCAFVSARIEEAPTTLTQQLQQKCSDWGTYWRASDAHGVVLTSAQAIELLQDALGVEVEIKDAAPAAAGGKADEVSVEGLMQLVNAYGEECGALVMERHGQEMSPPSNRRSAWVAIESYARRLAGVEGAAQAMKGGE